jgi:Fur family ferric uptake transcriptional regulator
MTGMQKKTTQRESIRQVLCQATRPLSPQEILEKARRHAPSTGLATVYRAVKELQGESWIRAVELPGEPARYELASKPHHHHFYCRGCGKVFDLEGCPRNLARMVPKGFRMEEHEITIRGLCPNCSG